MNRFLQIFLLLILFSPLLSYSQTAPGKYLIWFTDKLNNSYSVDQPESFLSQRALIRRQSQNITIKENDLPLTQMYLDSILSMGAVLHNTSKWFNNATFVISDTAILGQINALSFVQGYEKAQGFARKDYPDFPLIESKSDKKINGGYNYGGAANQIEMLRGEYLHADGYKGQGMLIAVIDAGFLYANQHFVFDSLWSENRVVATRDFVNGDTGVFEQHSHGMNVLSLMAADAPGEMVGTAPEASYLLLRSEDTDAEYRVEEDNWIAAAEYADSIGADIITTSLGYNIFTNPDQTYSTEQLDGNTARITIGADLAASKGIFVVSSAGNDGMTDWKYVDFPADGDSVFSIGAVDSNSVYATLSSVGPTADGRIKPDVAAQGKATYVAQSAASFIQGSGTSFSAPIISGLAACLWQAFPNLTNMELAEVIRASASQYSNPDSLLGYGIPDFYQAMLILHNTRFALDSQKGMMNAYPNPFNESITTELFYLDSQEVKIELIDMFGKIQYEKVVPGNGRIHFKETTQNLGGLSSGLYILRVSSLNNVWIRRIVKTTR